MWLGAHNRSYTPSGLNPIGWHFSAGGAASLTYEGFPVFQDMVKWGRFSAYPQAIDGNGWPTTDFTFYLFEGHVGYSWATAADGKFSCGYTSKNGGAETLTAVNGTITNKVVNVNLVTFDFQPTSPGSTYGVQFAGTTGGVTNMFAYLPAYRPPGTPGFNATTLITQEAIAHYSQAHHIRAVHFKNAWFDAGQQVTFTGTAAIGASSATLTAAITNGTYLAMFTCTLGSAPDVRSVTVSGGVNCAWTGNLTIAATGMSIPNSAANRNNATNTKTRGNWQGNGVSYEGYPLEWLIDLAIAANTSIYISIPINADATWLSDAASMVATKLANYPNIKTYWEIGNELWNGGYTRGASCVLAAMATFNGLTTLQQLAVYLRNLANALRAAFGTARFASTVNINLAWQAGLPGQISTILTYYNATYGAGAAAADLRTIAFAPYARLSITNNYTASLASTGIMTVSAVTFPKIGVLSTVTGAGVPAGSVITAQLNGTPFGVGDYQLSTSGTTLTSQAMSCYIDFASTTSQIVNQIAIAAPFAVKDAKMANLTVLALSFGLQSMTYEDGWDLSIENASITNCGAAATDPGFKAVMISHYDEILNSGVTAITAFDGGVDANTLDNRSPFDQFCRAFPITTANSPRWAAIRNYDNGFTPTKRVVNGKGSIIQGTDWADNGLNNGGYTNTAKANFANTSSNLAPRFADGYWPFQINCTVPGIYALSVTFSGCASSPVTDLEVNGTVLSTGTVISNAAIPLGNVTLVKGANYVLLGHNGVQTAVVEQLAFN